MVTLDQAGWNRSAVLLAPPPAPIGHVVEFLWVDGRPRQSPRAHEWRVVADDAPHLIYARYVDRLTRTERHRLHVVGPRQTFTDIDCRHRIVTVGARLKPGALPALLRASALEITDSSVDIESLVRCAGTSPLARFDECTPTAAVIRLGELVVELAARGRPLDARASRLAELGTGQMSVRELARRMGIGDRALRAWSATHLGMGIRRFMTIRRLHRALEHRIRRPDTWSRIAAAAGFADQSHLVRDCRALLGESPSEFLTRAR
jgi:AraC-like DNA-binding protein